MPDPINWLIIMAGAGFSSDLDMGGRDWESSAGCRRSHPGDTSAVLMKPLKRATAGFHLQNVRSCLINHVDQDCLLKQVVNTSWSYSDCSSLHVCFSCRVITRLISGLISCPYVLHTCRIATECVSCPRLPVTTTPIYLCFHCFRSSSSSRCFFTKLNDQLQNRPSVFPFVELPCVFCLSLL